MIAEHEPSPIRFHIPLSYLCRRADSPIKIDGKLDDPAWKNAPWSEPFQDIEGDAKPKPRFQTRVKMLWDDQYLYIGAELEEPEIWATLTKRDSVIFQDNDFEVFLDPDDDGQLYAELELNAMNTVWDLLLARPYRAGGPPITGWDIHGLHTAVHLDGTLNDVTKKSKGWSVEIAYPWAALREIARCPCPPQDGDQWRINFSRVEWDVHVEGDKFVKYPGRPEHNWVWSPQHVIDMHRPERWGILQFTDTVDGGTLQPHAGLKERFVLTAVWDAEHDFRAQHGRWSTSVDELGIDAPGVTLMATEDLFEAALGDYRIDSNQRFWKR